MTTPVYSQNGYEANNPALMTAIEIPGGTLRVRSGSVSIVFKWLAEQFNARVEPLKWPGCWGYAERQIRGGVEISNHASGTAVDFNAPDHPMTKRGTFTAPEEKAIRDILAEAGGVIRWGGNYQIRADEMHFEINANLGAVTAFANRILTANKMGITVSEAAGINANIDAFQAEEANRYKRYEAIHKEELTAIAASNTALLKAINDLAAVVATLKASS